MTSPVEAGKIPATHRRALILVVGRNPVVQRLEYFLEQAGFEVEFIADGLAALARAKELNPEILVTEILVPRMDGLGLCHALKSDPVTANIRVLVFSHLHAEDRALDAGADAFLIMPLDEERLIDTVAKLISAQSDSGRLPGLNCKHE